ncbi:SCO family protein [Granulicella sp. 5B5]|uniref:SCO family protein n=1 Tax=Granulicella sp. 5B5 TaxID=1617967 RepID=UPI0015F6AD2B|nr:SCO family protein [Granulicella sp. 5B5]QMV19922.1 SCO family protein [Granulicella sp. 5B5]
MRVVAVGCMALMLGVGAGVMGAQGYSADKPLGATAQAPPAYLKHAGIEQKLGQTLPMAATFTDSTGKTGALSTWYDGKPVVMAMVYYKCAMLCPQVLHGLATGLKATTLTAGKDYDVMVFSIDPTDTPQDAVGQKQQFLNEAGMTGQADAVHFLTAPKASIDALSDATGFHFVMVPGPDGKMDQYAHSSVIMFATPDGKMSKYLAGVSYEPRDLRMALLDASEKKISNPVDLLILYCCNYSPTAGKYSVSVVRILGIAGMVTLLIVIGMVYLLTRKPKGHVA